jgi:Ethanolamine utilization protein EutJ (predicted chaperonin)
MEEKEIQQRFRLLQQEVESAISLVEEVRLNCAAVADALKIDDVTDVGVTHGTRGISHRRGRRNCSGGSALR